MSFAFIRTDRQIAIALAFAALLVGGCNQSQMATRPYAQQAPVTLSPQQQTAMAQQTQQYQQRAATLDRDNQELQSMLAQSRQQTQLLRRAECARRRRSSRDTTDRLVAMQTDNDQLRGRTIGDGGEHADAQRRRRFAPTTRCCGA